MATHTHLVELWRGFWIWSVAIPRPVTVHIWSSLLVGWWCSELNDRMATWWHSVEVMSVNNEKIFPVRALGATYPVVPCQIRALLRQQIDFKSNQIPMTCHTVEKIIYHWRIFQRSESKLQITFNHISFLRPKEAVCLDIINRYQHDSNIWQTRQFLFSFSNYMCI